MEEPDFDVIVVGAGVAGCVAAHQLATAGHSVLLLERGEEAGSKNLSGGVFYCRVMEEVFPGFAEQAPVERTIVRNTLSVLTETSSVSLDQWDARLAEPVNAVSVLRARLDPWLAQQCEDAGVEVMPGVRVDALVMEGDQVVGVRSDEDELRASVVIVAEGVNSFLAQQAGIRAKEPTSHLAVGVKSVLRLPAGVIEDRFRVAPGQGAAFAMLGDATRGVAGGGFLYTNTDTLSLGVVLRLDSLSASGLSAAGIHDHFLAHPAIAPLVKDAELVEYGCHLTIEDGPRMVGHDLTRPGLMLIGDAAGFTLNTGFAIRGMDLAAGSALSASRAADAALRAKDLSQEAMDAYVIDWKDGWLGKDMATYSAAPAFLENDDLYTQVGPLVADVLHQVYRHDLTPRRHLRTVVRDALRRSPLTLLRLGRLATGALRSL